MTAFVRRRRLVLALDDAVVAETGNNSLNLGYDSSMDGSSGSDDDLREEVVGLRCENGDMRNFLAATASVVRERALMTELERSRMSCEDLRSIAV
jgi:hypothetical protein